MPAAGHVPQVLGQRVELAARHVGVRVVDQAGVQAQLAQQGERAQNGEAVVREVIDQPEDLLPLPLQLPLVDHAVPGMQIHLEHLLLLGGQVRGHLLLRAPHDQRPDPAAQLREQLWPVAVLDRPGVEVAEPARVREQPGRGDRQQRPELHQVVLHRRAGDRELERRGQLPGALVGLRLVVLDELRLVQQ